MSQKKIETSVGPSKFMGIYMAHVCVTGVNPGISLPEGCPSSEVAQALRNNNEEEMADFLHETSQLFNTFRALLTMTVSLAHGKLKISVDCHDCDELSRFTEMVESYFNDIVQA